MEETENKIELIKITTSWSFSIGDGALTAAAAATAIVIESVSFNLSDFISFFFLFMLSYALDGNGFGQR